MNEQASNVQPQIEQGKQPGSEVATVVGSIATSEIHSGEEGRLSNTPETHQLAIAEDYDRDMQKQGFKHVTNEPRQLYGDRKPLAPQLARKHGEDNVKVGKAFGLNGDPLPGRRAIYVRRERQDKAA